MSLAKVAGNNPAIALGVIGAAILAAWWMARGGVKGMANDVGYVAVRGAVGVAEGVTFGIADAVGVPRTNQTQCQKDLAAGNKWDASFSCPAVDFIKGVFN